ncbi:YggS family pyridoxal phosphate-dependent enzyme [Akkermansiaceae bacterium]|nr:YggS family pyridoxal phosphate-dependent enzyme [Akkermansiaceae bacterium]
MGQILDNLTEVREALAGAIEKSGRVAEDITLMAVSKHQTLSSITEAVEAGQLVFGENKVQEGIDKIPQFSEELQWHMIGHLQRNKVRKVLSSFHYVHGVDSLKLASYMNNVALDLGIIGKIFLQVNIGREEQKSGFLTEDLLSQYEQILALDNLDIQGLMCIPPAADSAEETRQWFAATRELRDDLEEKFPKKLPSLSMGMSSDYCVAIEEGATIVRVGSTIFGSRN